MPNAAFLSANSWLGFVAEVTRGTTPGTGTVFYVPVDTPQVTPKQTFLRDEAFRGSPNLVYDQVQGTRADDYDFKSYLYADTFPVYVKALLGGTDTVTTNVASYTHTIPLLNASATGSQPPSYSICDFDGANYFTLAGAQAASLNMTFGAEAAADATVKFIANPYTSATAAPAPFTSLSESGEHMIPAWDTTVSIGGTSLTTIVSGELMIDRKTQSIFTMGTQSPYLNFAGPIEVTGKFTAVVSSNADAWSTGATPFALTRSPEAIVITLTDPNDTHSSVNDSISFTMTTAQLHDVKRTRGKEYVEVEVSFTASGNSTDAASGYAPIKATIINGVSAAF